MTLEEFVSAPVSVEEFESAKNILIKIVNNIVLQPNELKFRRVRLTNKVLANALFPQAWNVLHCIGFQRQQDSEWLELTDEFVSMLQSWHARLCSACLKHSVPESLGMDTMDVFIPEHSIFFSGYTGACDMLRCRTVSKQWRCEAQKAMVQVQLAHLPSVLAELRFHGWFDLTAEFSVGDPIADFQKDLVGSPLTCYAGGTMRLKRPVITDISVADVSAFCRLNPWEMLKVGPYGLKDRPTEPTSDWWAKLYALVTTSELCGRQWEWSERSMVGNSLLYARHVIYVLARGPSRVTVTMRAVWDSSAY